MEKTTEQMSDEQKVEHQIAVRDEAGALSVVEQSAALVVFRRIGQRVGRFKTKRFCQLCFHFSVSG